MLRSRDIRRLLSEREAHPESVDHWCNRNGVDESALLCVVSTYGGFAKRPVIALVGFQLGYDARRKQEPRGRADRDCAEGEGARFGVQFVVVDRVTGTIVSDSETSQAQADDIAGLYNSADPEVARTDER